MAINRDELEGLSRGWGKPYGITPFVHEDTGHTVWMFRKGQKVRFFDARGHQFGPEQSNVAPAMAAMFQAGYYDRDMKKLYDVAKARQRAGEKY
jgi:hypothetical protein